ncbi:MAG: two-component system response regulator [Helicobacteraceae bacterium 4484_230]|nr:MAG: two-component system response regulator [Helicobacteraceae bacterium 4484_230]
MKKAKLLLLEDDVGLNETLKEYLEEEGYDVVGVYNGYDAQERLYEESFDLLLLDVNVPDLDGFSLLKEARKEGVRTPAIYITSRSGVQDVESGFESGGDDYLRKPFELKELLLRIRNILRRSFFHHSSKVVDLGGGFTYDIEKMQLYNGEEALFMGEKEGRLLKLFVQHKGDLLTHETIRMHLWNFDEVPSDDALRTYIKNLRKIIGKEKIVSHKRLGYKLG